MSGSNWTGPDDCCARSTESEDPSNTTTKIFRDINLSFVNSDQAYNPSINPSFWAHVQVQATPCERA
jgi:hypothetical protein